LPGEILLPTEDIATVEEFMPFVERHLFGRPRFYLCLAFCSMAGTEFVFLMPSERDGPEAAFSATAALTVATKAHCVFVGYQTDLKQSFPDHGDLGNFQGVFFMATAEGSHPYHFCRLISHDAEWFVRPFATLPVPDPKGRIFLADISQVIASTTPADVVRARDSCERWKRNSVWNWEKYDT